MEEHKYYLNIKNGSNFDFYYFKDLKDLEINFNALKTALSNKLNCGIEHSEGTTIIPLNYLQNSIIFFNAKIKIK